MTLIRSTIGLKVLIAVSGIILGLYVVFHMLANLKAFEGPESLNSYAHFLRVGGEPVLSQGQFLWTARIVLLIAVGVHIWAAAVSTLRSLAARPVGYRKRENVSSTFFSRTMPWTGAIVAFFVVYHLLDLTLGTVHPDFRHGEVYHNVVASFHSWAVALFYVFSVIALGTHLYHGIWSMMQTLGLNHPQYNKYRRGIAALITVAVVLGFTSVPLGVLAGIIR
jgi:succinate dehydrogenase / fumarate reductase cytochrome b subunit